jgi:hypothetical protein
VPRDRSRAISAAKAISFFIVELLSRKVFTHIDGIFAGKDTERGKNFSFSLSVG